MENSEESETGRKEEQMKKKEQGSKLRGLSENWQCAILQCSVQWRVWFINTQKLSVSTVWVLFVIGTGNAFGRKF